MGREGSERAVVASCVARGLLHVDAVRAASRRRKCGESVAGPFEEALGSDLVPAGSMGEGHADLRQALPEIALLGRGRFPACLEDLVGGEGATFVDELSGLLERLVRR
jgi:hypothetical protein